MAGTVRSKRAAQGCYVDTLPFSCPRAVLLVWPSLSGKWLAEMMSAAPRCESQHGQTRQGDTSHLCHFVEGDNENESKDKKEAK